MPRARHHTVPFFVLNHFARETDRGPRVCQFEPRTGTNRQISPRDAAVHKHFYSVIDEEAERSQVVEEALSKVESLAAPHIRRLANADYPTGDERLELALFIALARLRTPLSREQIRHTMEQALLYLARENASTPEAFRASLSAAGVEIEEDDIERRRQQLERALAQNRLGIDIPANNLIKLFIDVALEVAWIIFMLDCLVVRAPPGGQFIMADIPVFSFDPHPFGPSKSAALASSPDARTFAPIHPEYGLLLGPSAESFEFLHESGSRLREMDDAERSREIGRREGRWTAAEISDEALLELNLRSYANTDRFAFGAQHVLVATHRAARRDRPRLASYEPRPPQVHILEENPSEKGVLREVHTITPPRRSRERR